MNPEIFSQTGYLSVILWAAALVVFLVYWKKPSLLLCLAALGMTIGGFVCARINSKDYVNLIQLDRSEEMAKMRAQEEARKQALLASRGDEVAQVRFAEDGSDDFLDRAGMDETDLKFYERQGLGTPEWKKNKKERTAGGVKDDSIEAAIGGKKAISAVDASTFEQKKEREPIMMSEKDMIMANRLDTVNLRITLVVMIIGILLVLVDYVRRAIVYGKSSFPLPLPSSWLNALTPIAPILDTKKNDKKAISAEISRIVKRGDSFLLLNDEPSQVEALPESMSKFPLIGGREDLIKVTDEIDDDFIFESLWYGRSSFVVGTEARSEQLLRSLVRQLRKRKDARARVAQTSHVIIGLKSSLSAEQRQDLEELAEVTGFSILVMGGKQSAKKSSKPSKQTPSEKETQTNPEGELLTS